MKERPILFSAPMVRAILAGTKTQTRRIVNPVGNDEGFLIVERDDGSYWPWRSDDGESLFHTVKRNGGEYQDETPHCCPYGKPGDRLWVRETSRAEELSSGLDGVRYDADGAFVAIENTPDASDAWGAMYHYRDQRGATVPSIHMPRWASRIDLEVVSVRVERLNDISEEDAIAEGVFKKIRGGGIGDIVETLSGGEAIYISRGQAKVAYSELWESINGSHSWSANPWVWVVEFKRVTP